MDIANRRLFSQHIARADSQSAEEVVSWMGAMQAQDYAGSLWAIALRTPHLTLQDVEHAIVDRKIIRTWPMRGTLHFIAAKDARWMVKLLAPRATAAATSRRRDLGLTEAVIAKSHDIITSALVGGNCLTRNHLCNLLDENGIVSSGQRGIHLLRYFSEQGLLCFGPHEGKQPTFVLLDEWLAPTKELSRDEALAELTKRYFTSHGPATLKDFTGWANLTTNDARLGIAMAKDSLSEELIDGTVYWSDVASRNQKASQNAFLLPGFDEFMLGYRDRSAALHISHTQKIVPGGNGMFLPTIIINGQVVGTWKRIVRKKSIMIDLQPFNKLSSSDMQAIASAVNRYGIFFQTPTLIVS